MTLVPSGEKRGSPPKSLSWRTWVPLAAAVKTVTSPYLPPSRINKILPRRFVARGAEGFELSGFELSELQLPATTMRAIDTTTVTITASRLLIAPPYPSLACAAYDKTSLVPQALSVESRLRYWLLTPLVAPFGNSLTLRTGHARRKRIRT